MKYPAAWVLVDSEYRLVDIRKPRWAITHTDKFWVSLGFITRGLGLALLGTFAFLS